MKIQKLTIENRPKVYMLLQKAFPVSAYEALLVQKLHENCRTVHEWVCIHTNKAIAYIAFTPAYNGKETCGLLEKKGTGCFMRKSRLSHI
jgi:putative acetyltransferase